MENHENSHNKGQVAEMLKIDLSTVHNWTKKGILISYQIGGRVYYRRGEVENGMVQLKKKHHGS